MNGRILSLTRSVEFLLRGVFLVPPTGDAIRVSHYLSMGDRKLLFAAPTVPAATDFSLELRVRTKGAKPTGPLYTGAWSGTLHSS